MVRIWVQPGGKRDASPGLRVRARSSQWALGGTHAFHNKVFRIDYVFTSPSVSVLFMDTSHVVTTDRHP